MNTTVGKSALAILAGMITIIGLSIATDFILEQAGIFPSFTEQQEQGLFVTWMLLLALIYRCIYAVIGGYVTARFAPNEPLRHAIILGVLGFILSSIGAITMWDKSSHWYPIALVLTAIPCTWLGGKLKVNSE